MKVLRIIAGVIAFRYFAPMSELLEPYLSSPMVRSVTAFAILFVCTLLVGV